MIPPSDAGQRREMERMVWAAAFVGQFCSVSVHLGGGKDAASEAASWADLVAAAYREHGPTR